MFTENIATGTLYIERKDYVIDVASIITTIEQKRTVIKSDADAQASLEYKVEYLPHISCSYMDAGRNNSYSVTITLDPVHSILYKRENTIDPFSTAVFTAGDTESLTSQLILEKLEEEIKKVIKKNTAEAAWTSAGVQLNSILQNCVKGISKLN